MAEADVVQAQGSAMWSGIQALFITAPESAAFQNLIMQQITIALQNTYEAGIKDAGGAVSGISPAQEQSDIAAAVAAAIAPLNAQISDLQLAKAAEDKLLATVQTAAKALTALFPS